MSSIMFEGTDFESAAILVERSLFETIFRLEEARNGLRQYSEQQVRDALDWIISREKTTHQGQLIFERTDHDRELTGGYRSKTGEYIRTRYVKLPTGEPKWNLSVEYIHLLLAWEKESTPILKKAKDSLVNVYPGPYRRYAGIKLGYWCCGPCNALYQKTLKLADPELYAQNEEAFMDNLRKNRTTRGRWKNYPFYYTILTLEEIGTRAAREELLNVAEHMNPSLLERYRGDDRASKFRRLAIETVLKHQ